MFLFCFGWVGAWLLGGGVGGLPANQGAAAGKKRKVPQKLLGRAVLGAQAASLQARSSSVFLCSIFLMWPCGLMDKAFVFGTKDCRFESCQGQCLEPMCLSKLQTQPKPPKIF